MVSLGLPWRNLQHIHNETMSFIFHSIRKAGIPGAVLALITSSSIQLHADAPAEIGYAPMQVVEPGDSADVIAEKAAKVLPRPNQSAWMRLERTFFLHFGMNTFNGVEWGSGREDPSIFNPTSLDAKQWVGAMKNAGGNLIILVTKHHDGFCMWPTLYTGHSVVASPWKNGQGDLVREVADAAHAQGMKLGVYLSPADLYQLRTNPINPTGYYGNGSKKLLSVIPTDPATFQSDPSKQRTPAPGCGSYTYEVDDYNRYFLNQLYELLTQYGPLSVVWFDGANPDPSVEETYDYTAWYDLIHRLQPQAVISVKGPDTRWVGNEGGVGRTMEWSVIPLPMDPADCKWPDLYGDDLGSRAKLTPGSHLWWYPAEVNTSILSGWFWAPGNRVKSASELIDFYYTSVGRNGNMLLNLPPDTRGLIPDDQLASLGAMAQVINDTFAKNIAIEGTPEADSSNPANAPLMALDGNLDTWWEAASGCSTATFALHFPSAVTFDVISLQEAVDHRGQRIESFAVEALIDGKWTTLDTQTTVGHRRLLRLTSPVTTDSFRVRILSSRMEPTLAEVGLYRQATPVPPPTISDREDGGFVTLTAPDGVSVVYTTDGSLPTTESAVYRTPVPMPRGGTLHAALLTGQGRLGMIASKHFSGLVPTGWRVVSSEGSTEVGEPTLAIDGKASTAWRCGKPEGATTPCRITVDMGSINEIRGFTYLPWQKGSSDGVVELFRFETSVDGVKWTANVEDGRFGNIKNNPVLQEVTFPLVKARFFRFTSLRETDGEAGMCIGEISVLP